MDSRAVVDDRQSRLWRAPDRPDWLFSTLLALLVALTRWPALSRTLWDWDEANFALAVANFDVTAHHPHPPGFPLFVGLAKLIPFDAFHALQAIAFVSSLFVFPAMLFLARELRMPQHRAVAAALLLSFFRTSGSSAGRRSATCRRWCWP
jgi:hypothetical protein